MKRRELARIYATGEERMYREVLPSDHDPEWVDELVRLCESHGPSVTQGAWVSDIKRHLAKRGKK